MKIAGFVATSLLISVLAVSALTGPASSGDEDFTLVHMVPQGAFLYVAERNNPERDFIDGYWGEVFEALKKSGITEDVIDMFKTLIGQEIDNEQSMEMGRLKDRALELVAAVDWEQLAGKEFLFAEQFVPIGEIGKNQPPIFMPSMVWLFRGTPEGASKNFDGLSAILHALVEEVNNAAGAQVLNVDRETRMGTAVTSVNIFERVPGTPPMSLSIALRDDVIIIGMREQLFHGVLAILAGSDEVKPISSDPRFKAGFGMLPPAEDLMTFFDVEAMLKPMRTSAGTIIDAVLDPGSVYLHSGTPAEVNGLNDEAASAYRHGDIDQALALTRQAHEAAPENSIILYNLACYNAVAGNKGEALDWLEKAVEGGFYAPRKIAGDADLASLRGDSRFDAALARAYKLVVMHTAKDVCLNFAEDGEVFRLRMQVHQTYETKDYEQGLALIKQAYAIDPKDSKVVYTLACLHTLLGHEKQGLDILDQAVDAGFYCPSHLSKDPDLKSVRQHERFKAAMAKAKTMAGKVALRNKGVNRTVAMRIIDRLAEAVGVLDYSAAVETTDGYDTKMESVTVLSHDAKDRPFYKIFGDRPPLTEFEKYLPEETKSFSISGSIEMTALYDFIEDTVRLAGPQGEEVLAKWEGVQHQLGVDVRKDVMDWIDGDAINMTLADGGTVNMMKVKDEETARENISAAIAFTTTKLREIISQRRELAGLAMLSIRTSPIHHPELEGFQNLYFSMSPQPVVWGVADGYLIMGSSPEAIVLCLATARGDHPNIRSNEQVMKEAIVPDGPFSSVSLTDYRNLSGELEESLGIATMVTGMMSAFIPDPKARPVIAKISGILGKLTPVVSKIDFYKSSASQLTFDGKVWRARTVTHYFSPEERVNKEF